MDAPLEDALRKLEYQYTQSLEATQVQQLPWELKIHDPLSAAFREALATSPSNSRENIVALIQNLLAAAHKNELHIVHTLLFQRSLKATNPAMTLSIAVYAVLHNKPSALNLCLQHPTLSLHHPLLTLALEINPTKSPSLLDILYSHDHQHIRSSPFASSQHALWSLRTSAVELAWFLDHGARFYDDRAMLARAVEDANAPFFKAECVDVLMRRCGSGVFAGMRIASFTARRGRADVLGVLLRWDCGLAVEREVGDCLAGRVGSPLLEAVERRHLEVVELLLSFGADPRRLEVDGRISPLALAEGRGDREMVALLEQGIRSGREVMARI